MEGPKTGPADWREWRRLRAVYRKQQGWYPRDIAEALDGSEDPGSRWRARARQGGVASLRARPVPGHPPKLTPQQQRLIPEFLWHGPEAYGFRGAVWTWARLAQVIEEEFGVRYHKGHVSRLLKDLGWTPQVPVRRALQRHEEAIRRWRHEVWPDLLRRAGRERRVLVFEDESGFYLLPGVVRTYAPEADTPVLPEGQTRDHLSVMGGRTPAGKVYTRARQASRNGWHGVAFLQHLLRVAGARLLVIWDGSPIPRRTAVKDFVARTRGQIGVEALPGSAPDLNPWDEGGWNHLKNVALRNLACRDLEELHQAFYLAIARLRQRPELVQAFLAQAGLQLKKV